MAVTFRSASYTARVRAPRAPRRLGARGSRRPQPGVCDARSTMFHVKHPAGRLRRAARQGRCPAARRRRSARARGPRSTSSTSSRSASARCTTLRSALDIGSSSIGAPSRTASSAAACWRRLAQRALAAGAVALRVDHERPPVGPGAGSRSPTTRCWIASIVCAVAADHEPGSPPSTSSTDLLVALVDRDLGRPHRVGDRGPSAPGRMRRSRGAGAAGARGLAQQRRRSARRRRAQAPASAAAAAGRARVAGSRPTPISPARPRDTTTYSTPRGRRPGDLALELAQGRPARLADGARRRPRPRASLGARSMTYRAVGAAGAASGAGAAVRACRRRRALLRRVGRRPFGVPSPPPLPVEPAAAAWAAAADAPFGASRPSAPPPGRADGGQPASVLRITSLLADRPQVRGDPVEHQPDRERITKITNRNGSARNT